MINKQRFPLDIGWSVILKDFGLQPRHILRRANLPEDLLSRGNAELTTDDYFRFWRALEQEANDVCFPLRLVETLSTEIFTPPLFAALCSANLMQAAQRLAKYKPLVAPMSLDIHVGTQGQLTLSPRWLTPHHEVPFSLQVVEVAFFVQLARIATREPIQAQRICLPTLPPTASLRRYESFLGVGVQVGSPASITFAASDALRPFLITSEGMWRVFEPELRRQLCQLESTASTTERVHALLLELLPSNAATIEMASARLGMSKRTLQRRLEDEGENFRHLVSRTRESLARHYLENTSMSGGEIAFLLGFEDPNSFYRAFQEWTGKTTDRKRHTSRPN